MLVEEVPCLLVDDVCIRVCVCILTACVHMCMCVLEFWPWVLWHFTWKSFWGLDKMVHSSKEESVCFHQTLSWSYQVKDHFKFSAWFFCCCLCNCNGNSAGKPGLSLWVYRGNFFFRLAAWLYLSLGQVYFWFVIILAGIGIGDSRFPGGCWLDNMPSLPLHLSFMCPAHLKTIARSPGLIPTERMKADGAFGSHTGFQVII